MPHHAGGGGWQASPRDPASRFGVNPKIIANWRKRAFVADQPKGPKAPRSTTLSPDQEAIIVAFRRHTLLPLGDCLYTLHATIPQLPRSSLQRCLQRHGISCLPEVEGEGLKAAIAPVLGATWQRCRVYWMRNALPMSARPSSPSPPLSCQAFLRPDQASARQTWRHVADQLRPRWPKLGKLMDDSEDDVLAYMAFPPQHRTKLHSTVPLERLNKKALHRSSSASHP